MKDTRNYGKKFSHEDVRYEHPAKGPHSCIECEHYRYMYGKASCTGVVDPIRPEDWCVRFDLKR